jgi:hypothetical protein
MGHQLFNGQKIVAIAMIFIDNVPASNIQDILCDAHVRSIWGLVLVDNEKSNIPLL